MYGRKLTINDIDLADYWQELEEGITEEELIDRINSGYYEDED